MTTLQATQFYNLAEQATIKANSKCFIDRTIEILDMLENLYGEEKADAILELVFENEI